MSAEQQTADGGRQTADGPETEAPVAVEAASDEATLPPVPEGAILSEVATAAAAEAEVAAETEETVEDAEGAVPAIRLIGEGVEIEDTSFADSDPVPLDFQGVMLALVDAALDADKGGAPLTGQMVAQIFCKGDVEDPRVEFLLLLLAQDKPVDGPLVLAAARATEGLETLVEEAVATREELERVGDVSVEQLSAGSFVPVARELGAEVSA